MKFNVTLRVKLQNGEWMAVGKTHSIPWGMRDLIVASSGWSIMNEESAGAADSLATELKRGIIELQVSRDTYVRYEVKHGIGSINEVIAFYQGLYNDCKEYPFAEVYGAVVE